MAFRGVYPLGQFCLESLFVIRVFLEGPHDFLNLSLSLPKLKLERGDFIFIRLNLHLVRADQLVARADHDVILAHESVELCLQILDFSLLIAYLLLPLVLTDPYFTHAAFQVIHQSGLFLN